MSESNDRKRASAEVRDDDDGVKRARVARQIETRGLFADETTIFLDERARNVFMRVGLDFDNCFELCVEIRNATRRSSVFLSFTGWLTLLANAEQITNFFNLGQKFNIAIEGDRDYQKTITIRSTLHRKENHVEIKSNKKDRVLLNANNWNVFLIKKNYIRDLAYRKVLTKARVLDYYKEYVRRCDDLSVNFLTMQNFFPPGGDDDGGSSLRHQKLFTDFSLILHVLDLK